MKPVVRESPYADQYGRLLRHLRQRREALRLTQAQFGERLGLSQHYVSRYELGDRRLDIFELDAICYALGITLADFWALFKSGEDALDASLTDVTHQDVPSTPPQRARKSHRGAPSPRHPAEASRAQNGSGVGADAGRRVERALTLLTGEDEALSIADVAARVGWSADHLRRMFWAVLNASPHQVQMTARLNRAHTLLLESDASVSEVAGLCGFPNASHFAQTFKREFGVSPRELRAARSNSLESPETGSPDTS